MVRIRLPPAESQQTFGSARDFREGPSISTALVDKVHSAAIGLTTSPGINTGAISALCSAT